MKTDLGIDKRNRTLNEIDQDDAPELDDAFFSVADLYAGEQLIRRGRPKELTSSPP